MSNTKRNILFLYEWGVIAVALILVCVGFQHHHISIGPITFLSLLTLTIGTELIMIPLSVDAYTTLTSSVAVGIIMILGPDLAALFMAIASLIVPILQRQQYRKVFLFNASNYVLCINISSWVTGLLFHSSYPIHLQIFSFDFLSILCLMLIFHIVNHLLIDFLFLVRDGSKSFKQFWNVFLVDGIHHFLGAPLAILMVQLQDFTRYLVLALVPLAMMGQVLRLNRNLSATQKVQQFANQLNKEFDFDSIATQALQYIIQKSAAANAAFLFMDDSGTKLITRFVGDPSKDDFLDVYDFEKEEARGIVYSVVKTRNAENINHVSKDKRAKYDGDTPSYESMMVIPLTARNEVIGICMCYGKRPFAFSRETFQLIAFFAMQVGVILENARLYSGLQEMVSRDGTTGLYNYRYFYQELSRRFELAKDQQLPFTVAVIDIDYFKQYNDMYGHLVGDEVIRQVGSILTNEIGTNGLVARYGGEEFAILLDQDTEASYEIIERTRKTIGTHHFEYQSYRVGGITISSGVASYPEHDQHEKHLLEKADQALYWGAKQRGRNKTAVYSDELDKHLYVDSATKLYTVHYLSMCLKQEIQLKHETTMFSIICMKLLGLEQLVQMFGLERKEQLIQQLASLIRSSIRQEEIACRYGDGEFMLFVPGTERVEAEKMMERILKKITEQTFHPTEKVISKLRMLADIIWYPATVANEQVMGGISDVFQVLRTQAITQFKQEQSI